MNVEKMSVAELVRAIDSGSLVITVKVAEAEIRRRAEGYEARPCERCALKDTETCCKSACGSTRRSFFRFELADPPSGAEAKAEEGRSGESFWDSLRDSCAYCACLGSINCPNDDDLPQSGWCSAFRRRNPAPLAEMSAAELVAGLHELDCIDAEDVLCSAAFLELRTRAERLAELEAGPDYRGMLKSVMKHVTWYRENYGQSIVFARMNKTGLDIDAIAAAIGGPMGKDGG